MSATFRLSAKKKISQDELRKLMAEQKGKIIKRTPKINNPLAKYNDVGQLMCVLCNTIVRSESVWQVHVNAKQHKNHIEEAKRLKELTNNFTTTVKVKKRSSTPPSPIHQEKKLKSILKNAPITNYPPSDLPPVHKNNAPIIIYHNEDIKRGPLPVTTTSNASDTSAAANKEDMKKNENSKDQSESEQPIPEGFFDDPILDAKVRNIEYKDPIEEEWEKFQKEIREEASASAEIIAGEQEEATAERQIDEIDEQMRNWSRVLDLELKKEEAQKKKQDNYDITENQEGNDTDNEVDIDEFLDWRAKKAYR